MRAPWRARTALAGAALSAACLSLACLSLACLSSGCAMPPRAYTPTLMPVTVPESGPDGFPVASVKFQENLSWPYRLEVLTIVIDGTEVYHARGDDIASGALLGVVELEPGRHRLEVEAQASYAATPMGASDDCSVTMRSEGELHVHGPLQVHLDLHASDVTAPFAERFRLTMASDGGMLDGGAESREVSDEMACSGSGPLLQETELAQDDLRYFLQR